MSISTQPFSWERFNVLPLCGILRSFTPDQVRRLAHVCAEGGLGTLEVTMNSPAALELIAELAAEYSGVLNVGAGTVCTVEELEAALAHGAQFIITPYLNTEIIKTCNARHIPIFPGAYSPTEIYGAWTAGADIVKVFPASQLGPSFLRDISGPFPQIKLMPTGGVTPETLPAFRAAGAVAFSVGSSLFDKARVDAGDYSWVSDQLERFIAAIASSD